MNRRGGLGRGLAALIPEAETQGGPDGGDEAISLGTTLRELPIEQVIPNPNQPRTVFDDEELLGLAASIEDMGILQPIVVRPLGEDRYELVAGERRLRASKIVGLERVPAIVRHTEDGDLLKEALVENIHRVQLNPLEEAAAYQQLLDDFGFTQEELAKKLGKSRPSISNALRLMSLPSAVQRKVAAGVLTAGHAKALLALDDKSQQELVADRIINEGLSVRATEELVRVKLLDEPGGGSGGGDGGGGGSAPTRRRGTITAPALVQLQEQLSDALSAKVRIGMGKRSGKVAIQFRSIADLERIVDVITAGIEADASRPRD